MFSFAECETETCFRTHYGLLKTVFQNCVVKMFHHTIQLDFLFQTCNNGDKILSPQKNYKKKNGKKLCFQPKILISGIFPKVYCGHDRKSHRFNAYIRIACSCNVYPLEPLFMPPTLKKLEGHIAFGLSVCLSVCVCVRVYVC